jgi:serine/threonine-protein kinase
MGLGALVLPGKAAAQNYGAIAYSPSTGADGWAFDYPTRGVAESMALQDCRKYADDCTVPLWFRDACGALAVGDNNGYGTGWGTSRSIAESYALQTCRKFTSKCAIRRWACTSR